VKTPLDLGVHTEYSKQFTFHTHRLHTFRDSLSSHDKQHSPTPTPFIKIEVRIPAWERENPGKLRTGKRYTNKLSKIFLAGEEEFPEELLPANRNTN
jgi:hypothetical protein